MSLRRYYNNLSEAGRESFLDRVGTTKRYFEYFILRQGNNSKTRRFPRDAMLDAIHLACDGHVTYLEILCELIPKAQRDLDFLLRVRQDLESGVAGARPRPIETNASRAVNGDQSYTTSVDTDQSIYGG